LGYKIKEDEMGAAVATSNFGHYEKRIWPLSIALGCPATSV